MTPAQRPHQTRARARWSRSTRRVALASTLAMFLTSCATATVTDPSWSPPSWPDPVLTVSAAVQPAPAPAESEAPVTPVRIRNSGTGIQARVAYLPGTGTRVAAFNTVVDDLVWQAIQRAEELSGLAYRPMVENAGAGLADRDCRPGSSTLPAGDLLADPVLGPPDGIGVAVTCEILMAAGPVFAERIRVLVGEVGTSDEEADPAAYDTLTTLYVDTDTGQVYSPRQLWNDDAVPVLSAAVVDSLRRDQGALTLRPADGGDQDQLAFVDSALESTVPVPGGLAVTIPAGFVASELVGLGLAHTDSPLTLVVPADLAAPLVTAFGARLLASEGQPYSGPAQISGGHAWTDCQLVPCVALTYDDGPSELTETILDELDAVGGAASFFVLGHNVRSHAEVLNRMVEEGHDLGNHTWNHPSLPDLKPEEVAKQVGDTNAVLASVTGQRPRLFRPPYGAYNDKVLAEVAMPFILWDVDTLDWQQPDPEVLISRAVDGARPGSIVLQHDIHLLTATTAPAVFEGLLDRGFVLSSLSQLFGGELPRGGVWTAGPR